jgi:hypothetical protein
MQYRTLRYLAIASLVVALVSIGTTARAQVYTGRIDITIEDSTGGRLPGVAVDLSGQMVQTATTDARGEVHFLNLNVGSYQVKATLAGFNEWKSGNLAVASGVSIPLTIKMNVAGAKEEVTVTGESPVLDNKKQTTAVNVSLEELQNVPSARDPWVVMQSVPGIVMDRVNVGGSESGQQSGFMGKGAASGDTTWNVDGMPITDMSSLSSPFYFDFDMFQEMSVVTGGSDAKSATGGVQMNFMLRSGTNTFHGQAKFYDENPRAMGWMQANNMPADLAKSLGSATGAGDKTQLFQDWGGDLGGPILKDRWWFWGAWGDQDVRIVKMSGVRDRTVMKNASFKTQGQITKSLRGSFTFFQANKMKWGRNAGATCDQNCSVDQQGFGGPNRMYKGEINYNIGNNLFLVARYAKVKGGFQLIPEGGIDAITYFDNGGVQHGSSWTYITDRPQKSFVMDGNYFKGNHEIKFGFTWRKAETHSTSVVGQDYASDDNGNGYPLISGSGYPFMAVNIVAPWASDVAAKYLNFYIGDTISLKRMTINAGVRYDYQVADVLPTAMAAPKNANGLLPSVTAPGITNATTYKLPQPRVGLTYSVDEARKTQLRATYAMFTSQIGSGDAGFLSVAQYRHFYIDAKDLNGDHIAQPNEFLWNTYAAHIANGDYSGYDPANPGGTASAINKLGSYGNPKTHEAIIGVDHELLPNFGVSASFTYRRIQNFNWRPTISSGTDGVIDGSDFVLKGNVTGALPSGITGSPDGTYTVPYYGLGSGVPYDASKGGIWTTRPDYHQIYKGFEISATKRMSSRWMARFGFSTNSWREYFDSAKGQGDPTPTLATPNINGGYVVSAAGGSGKSSIYMVQPKYQIIANGVYQLPYDIDLGANYLIREGYPMPWNRSTTGGFSDPLGSTKRLLLPGDFGYARLPAVQTLDFRIGKRQKLGRVTVNVDLDVFNLFNSPTTLGREYRFTSSRYTQIAEIMQPRIARIGARIQF